MEKEVSAVPQNIPESAGKGDFSYSSLFLGNGCGNLILKLRIPGIFPKFPNNIIVEKSWKGREGFSALGFCFQSVEIFPGKELGIWWDLGELRSLQKVGKVGNVVGR